jgi:hypothetical protein
VAVDRAKARAAAAIQKNSVDGGESAEADGQAVTSPPPTIVIDPYQPWDMTEREKELALKYLKLITGVQYSKVCFQSLALRGITL